MDRKSAYAHIAKAFSESGIDINEIPDAIAAIAVSYANEVRKASDLTSADTFVFIVLDRLLERWRTVREGARAAEMVRCEGNTLGEYTNSAPCGVAADYFVKWQHVDGRRLSAPRCDAHAAVLRNELMRAGREVHLERIPK